MVGLLTSPPEIILSILGCCDLSSVYTLRRTCKTLHELSHDRIVWIIHLARGCRTVDTPLAQFNLNAMTANEIEARATSKHRMAHTLRNSGSIFVTAHEPFSTRSIKSPTRTNWRATSSSPGGRWMAAVLGAALQIWDTSFTGQSPSSLASLEVPELGGTDRVWIHWYYSSENYHVFVVYRRIGDIGAARQFVLELEVDGSGTPSLNLRGVLQTSSPTYLHLDEANPTGPLLALNLFNDELRVWYPESEEQLLVNEPSVIPAIDLFVCRGFIFRFGNNKTSITISKVPTKEELLTSTEVPVIQNFDYRHELDGYHEHEYRLAGIHRSQIVPSRHPDYPLVRFVLICDFQSYDRETERDIIICHKAIFIDETDGKPTFELKTLSIFTASGFPTPNDIPDRPLLELGNEWFLWWTVPRSMYSPHLQVAVYLLADPKTGKKDSGSFLKLGTDDLELDDELLEFDPVSGRAVCAEDDTLHFIDFV
ncbi:hypothetical protein DL96DRAFT_1626352 [Flagelloscypha sp. PMI_526]|nr:hypothetical protein DL96DRAFT_1626352 [Flagelloscypha sp. PMI_526]